MRVLVLALNFVVLCTATILSSARAQAVRPFLSHEGLAQRRVPLNIQPNNALIYDLPLRDSQYAVKSRANVTSAIRSSIDVEFDEIKRVCNLSRGQLANLETAARVAVEETVDAWFEVVESHASRSSSSIANSSAKSVEVVALTAAWRERELNDGAWRKVVEGILTKDQKTQLVAERSRRAAFARVAEFYGIVAVLDLELFLSADQREQMLKLVRNGEAKLTRRVSQVTVELDKSTADAVMQLLTKSQWDLWQELTKDSLDLGTEIKVQ